MAGSSTKKNSNESTKKKRKLTNSQDSGKPSKSARKKNHVAEQEERCAVDETRTLENTEGDTQNPVEKVENFQWRNLDLVLALDMRTLTAEK